MEQRIEMLACDRANDLVAVLYGEVTDAEKRAFEQHLRGCVTCRSEFAAFGGIRTSIGLWRQEALGVLSPSSCETAPARRRSAVTAITEFFDLSPLWLKGTLAFASLIFCLLAVLVGMHLTEKPLQESVANQTGNGYSEKQLAEMVEKRVQQRMAEVEANKLAENARAETLAKQPSPQRPPRQVRASRSQMAANTTETPATQRPLTRAEREQLAADLRLVAGSDESDLDLLGDRINRPD